MKKQRRNARRQTTTKKIAHKEAKKVFDSNVESKMYDGKLQLAGEVVDYNGILYNMFTDNPAGTTITQGPGRNQYLGLKIKPYHIELRYAVTNDLADSNNLITCVVLQAKGSFVPGGTTANIFESTGNVSAPLSPFDHQFNQRFKVLYRKQISLSGVDGEDVKVFTKNISHKRLSMLGFNDAIGTIQSGTLLIGWISDSGAAVHPTVRAQWRILYKDA